MKNNWAIVPSLTVALTLVAGCGDKVSTSASQPTQIAAAANPAKLNNSTVKDAGDALVKALIEGDRQAIESLNHSSPESWPTTHLMKTFGPEFQKTGTDRARALDVQGTDYRFSFDDNVHKFEFLKEKDGYFFVSAR